MGARICAVPGCEAKLNSCVSEKITLCGEHQYQLSNAFDRYPEVRQREDDVAFLTNHVGGCTVEELAGHLGKGYKLFCWYIAKGGIWAERVRYKVVGTNLTAWRFMISPLETARVIVLERYWMTVLEGAKLIGADRQAFRGHALREMFGPTTEALNGDLCIKRRDPEELRRVYREAKRQVHVNTQRQEQLQANMFTIEDIAALFGARRLRVNQRIINGDLESEMWMGKRIISGDGLHTFLLRLVDKAVPVGRRFNPKRATEILAQYSKGIVILRGHETKLGQE